MTKALIRSGRGRRSNVAGIVPAACSAVVPGLGQLINGDTDKAIGVFVVAAVSASSVLGALPLIGPVAGLVWGATWLYGVADGYLEGRKKR
jgi:TM2 domain-containing membrane protein YozV